MASHYEGADSNAIPVQEYYQGYDAYGQPLGFYDSSGQLSSQTLEGNTESFQYIDNAIPAQMQLPEQTVHPNFNQGFSDMFDPASNDGFPTAPNTTISHYDQPTYVYDPGYDLQPQHLLQQDPISAGINAPSELGIGTGEIVPSGPQPMDYWYIDPSQRGYAPSMDSMPPQQNMSGTLLYPEPQAAGFPDPSTAYEQTHWPTMHPGPPDTPSHNSIFPNPLDTYQHAQYQNIPPVSQAALPNSRCVQLGGYTLDLPAETTDEKLQQLDILFWNLDAQQSKTKLKRALEIIRSPQDQLTFLEGIQAAIDKRTPCPAFGNGKSTFAFTCSASYCLRVVLDTVQKEGFCKRHRQRSKGD
ncbi:hypothetical protein HD553DRAFT_346757 [Filobasidium floriforme]|uniref:uncharacterized protein n=1 Tax=Filobasidium floriforme TaxID=5210 RepID=UPI001E8DD2E3|nr:uncharacterized protein HD553DRAFT_346757 [Filobasidium floriforme]KAH8077233.1 hypothetical protein HD553DRAFT_346757 [Filobasidium floriforme]